MSEDKELMKQSLEKNLKNAKNELRLMSKAREAQLARKNLLQRKIDVQNKMHQIAMRDGGLVPLKPSWTFQTFDDYIEAQKEQSMVEYEMKKLQDDEQMELINKNMDVYDEQLASQRKNVEETEKKISELGE